MVTNLDSNIILTWTNHQTRNSYYQKPIKGNEKQILGGNWAAKVRIHSYNFSLGQPRSHLVDNQDFHKNETQKKINQGLRSWRQFYKNILVKIKNERCRKIPALHGALTIPRCSLTIRDEIKQLSCIKTQSSSKCHCLSWCCNMYSSQQLIHHLHSTREQNIHAIFSENRNTIILMHAIC